MLMRDILKKVLPLENANEPAKFINEKVFYFITKTPCA